MKLGKRKRKASGRCRVEIALGEGVGVIVAADEPLEKVSEVAERHVRRIVRKEYYSSAYR